MLHNTGPYGPNETPVNMGAPNIPELGTSMNIAQNFNHFVKLSQQTTHTPSGHFNLQNYSEYAGTSISSNPPVSVFPSYSYTDNNPKSTSQNSNNHFNTSQHNGAALEKTISQGDDNQKAIDFSNLAKNLDKTTKNPQIKPSIGMIEISDLLSNNSKSTDKRSDIETHNKKGDDQLFELWKNFDLKKLNHNKHKKLQSSETSDAKQSSDGESSDGSAGYSNDSEKRNRTVQKKSHENKQNSSEPEDSEDDDSTNASGSEDTPKEIASNCKTNEQTEIHKETDSNYSKPINLFHFIKQEPMDPDIDGVVDTNVIVKIEPISSWTDTEHMQPFLKDINGILKEDSNLTPESCVDSVAEAIEIIKKGVKTDLNFECPNCCLLFTHPKRFLIHTKWHSFGLINEKRIEEAKEKMECRRQKKEMQMQVKKEAAAKARAEEKERPPTQEVFECKSCDKKFSTKSKLRNHRHKLHPTRERECKICHKMVMGWFGLQTHMASHNTNGYECDICSKRFKHAHSLAKHRDTHLEKTHGCAECPKKFGSQTLLKIHMRSHERAQRGRTFRCSYCGKGFYEAYTLQYHERTHRNERPFKCTICETSYGTNSSLKRHLKVSHSRAKPFECDTCRRCFVTALIRDRHAAREHGTPGQLNYACTQCTSRYLRLKDLQRHMYRIHPKGKKRRKDSDSE